VTTPIALGILLLLSPPAKAGPAPSSGVVTAPAVAPTFEELWSGFVAADAAGNADAAERALREIRRTRIERNVESLDTLGLALVERGVARLDAGKRQEAEDAFRAAVALAPGLPDGHAGLAVALLKKGPLGLVPSIEAAISGVSSFLPSGRGALSSLDLATVAALLALFGTAWALAAALLLRRGGLLLHDLEEWLGPAQSHSASLALFALVLLLPVATFQGWGWLPMWSLAVLFSYLDGRERALACLLLAGALAVGPAVGSLDLRLRTARNPLFHAALAAVETAPDGPAIRRLEEAARKDREDRDLVYLLGSALRRAGRYGDAAELYRQALARDPGDAVARNNLANIEFVSGSYDSARARYRAGTEVSSAPEIAATSFYNLSLLHLQQFEYQAYNEAKSNADRLAPALVADYDRWRYETRDYAVVDLGLGREDVAEKFAGTATGVGVRNVATGGRAEAKGGLLVSAVANRFGACVALFALLAFLVGRWRGRKAFTLHCGRCGTAFCRSCHLGQVSGGLCSQCYHLFVVRDGVSGPARNRKMAEVQQAEGRRDRVFRVLSVLSPGAGQVYGGWAFRGALLLAAWYGVLALLLAGRVVPFTEVPRRLSTPWLSVAAGLVLLSIWGVANRFRPGRDVELPARPAGPRRARSAAAAAG
jgi:tetratricopeptide (TPR) repeat protein